MIENRRKKILEEYKYYVRFWLNKMLTKDGKEIYPELSQQLIPNKLADMGVMYLGRILYGATRASKTFKEDQLLGLADAAFNLMTDFKNPSGGYYWSRKYNMEWSHDADNVNMAQAFVLYGLSEYETKASSPAVLKLIDEQLTFIQANLKDVKDDFYLDGFDQNWARTATMSRSFGSHFHVLEAMVLVFEQNNSKQLEDSIRKLISMIIDRFIDKNTYECLHRFSEGWELMPNENWAGHNAEFSWVICEAAKAINDASLISLTEELAVNMMKEVVKNAFDKENGGCFNAIDGNVPLDSLKSWWPQAEVVLGLLNVYKITGDEKYHKLAIDQIDFISKRFVGQTGEWYAEIQNNGTAVTDVPLVFFWKSMYHTVRYYDYLINFMK